VLLASPLPPPSGGIATWTRIVLEEGFCGDYEPVVVNTSVSARRAAFEEPPRAWDELARGLQIATRFARALLTERPRLVHVNSSLSAQGVWRDLLLAVLARSFRRPVVVQYHGAFPEPPDPARGALGRWALRWLVGLASTNLVLGEVFVAALGRSAHGRGARALPNFIDDSALARPAANRELRVGTLRVVYLGSLIASKGSRELVEVARRLPALSFTAFGSLPSGEEPDVPPNLRLAGSIAREQVLDALDASDVLLFPSHGEGFPYAVLEAMASRLPVVASRVGAIPDMIDEGRGGFLLAPRDVPGLCGALESLARDPELRARMGAHNRRRVEADYTRSRVMAQLARIYDELLATPRYRSR
jgi:glycosyltransferase involved in cell wall biosynthesis